MRISLARAAAAVFLAIGLLFVGSGISPANATTPMTATEGVNVRSGPSASDKIIAGLYRGQTIDAISTSNGWVKLKISGKTGYVSSKYLAKGDDLPISGKVNAGEVRKTTTAVNLRKGPGMSYDLIKVLKQGTRVTLTGKTSKGYVQVVNGSSTGYVSSQYLTSSASGLPTVIGTRVATATLDIRTTSGSDAKTVAEVKKGTKLSVTGATANGRAQIVYKKAIRWVTAKYLANPEASQPTAPGLPKVTGTRYATASLNIRSTSADKYTLIAEVDKGTKLSITGVVKNGRMQIIWDSTVRWVTNKYLSKSKPSTASPSPGSAAVEKGLQPNAIKTYRAVIKKFPQIKTVGGKRPDSLPDHPSGRALDIMVPNYKSASGKKLGGQIAAWLKSNAKSLGVNYVIWNQHIWNITRDKEGWRYMASRGSDSANHKNHVHVTVFADGYAPR